jgi:hypothetical protein
VFLNMFIKHRDRDAGVVNERGTNMG